MRRKPIIDNTLLRIVHRIFKKHSKRAFRNIVKYQKAQQKKQKEPVTAYKGLPPRKISGKWRKSFKTKTKFKGAGRPDAQGNIPFAKVGGFSTLANVRQAKNPTPIPKSMIESAKRELFKKAEPEIKKEIIKRMQAAFFDEISSIPGAKRTSENTITIDIKI